MIIEKGNGEEIATLYCENWEQIQKRYEAFWALENHDRPLLNITAPKKNRTKLLESKHKTLKDRWTDTEFVIQNGNLQMQNTVYAGEAFPMLWPNLGPDVFASLYGTEMIFGEDTAWAVPFLSDEDVEQGPAFTLDRNGAYYQKLMEMTKAIAEDAKDKYIVGITDLHPGADGLVSMRGPENLCYDTIDHPEFIQKGTMALLKGFQEICDELYTITTQYQRGSANWSGIWHPGKWYVTSCDFCCMISEDMFEDLIAPELELELDYLDANIYHMDGPGAIKHLDRLLNLKKLQGIQWVPGAGQPSASYWLPMLRKIQDSGRMIQVNVELDELETMLKHLRPEGVFYNLSCRDEEEAAEVLKFAEKVRFED